MVAVFPAPVSPTKRTGSDLSIQQATLSSKQLAALVNEYTLLVLIDNKRQIKKIKILFHLNSYLTPAAKFWTHLTCPRPAMNFDGVAEMCALYSLRK